MTSNPEPVINKFTAGTVEIEVNEHEFEDITDWAPGDVTDKQVSVINKGSKATYVRVCITPTWSNQKSINNVKLYLNNQDWAFFDNDEDGQPDDGYYYYKNILDPNQETTNLLNKVELLSDQTDDGYQSATLEIEIKAESVQASHEAYKDVWNIPQLPDGVEVYIDE